MTLKIHLKEKYTEEDCINGKNIVKFYIPLTNEVEEEKYLIRITLRDKSNSKDLINKAINKCLKKSGDLSVYEIQQKLTDTLKEYNNKEREIKVFIEKTDEIIKIPLKDGIIDFCYANFNCKNDTIMTNIFSTGGQRENGQYFCINIEIEQKTNVNYNFLLETIFAITVQAQNLTVSEFYTLLKKKMENWSMVDGDRFRKVKVSIDETF